MSNHSRAESPAGKHSLVPVLVMHAILTVLLFVALIWLVPRFLLQFEDLLGVSPTPVEQLVTGVSDFFVRFRLFLLPVAAILLWLDARLCRMLQVRFGQCVVGVWSPGNMPGPIETVDEWTDYVYMSGLSETNAPDTPHLLMVLGGSVSTLQGYVGCNARGNHGFGSTCVQSRYNPGGVKHIRSINPPPLSPTKGF